MFASESKNKKTKKNQSKKNPPKKAKEAGTGYGGGNTSWSATKAVTNMHAKYARDVELALHKAIEFLGVEVGKKSQHDLVYFVGLEAMLREEQLGDVLRHFLQTGAIEDIVTRSSLYLKLVEVMELLVGHIPLVGMFLDNDQEGDTSACLFEVFIKFVGILDKEKRVEVLATRMLALKEALLLAIASHPHYRDMTLVEEIQTRVFPSRKKRRRLMEEAITEVNGVFAFGVCFVSFVGDHNLFYILPSLT